jgi:hypothetical protein
MHLICHCYQWLNVLSSRKWSHYIRIVNSLYSECYLILSFLMSSVSLYNQFFKEYWTILQSIIPLRVSSVNVIILLLLSDLAWPKVLTSRGGYPENVLLSLDMKFYKTKSCFEKSPPPSFFLLNLPGVFLEPEAWEIQIYVDIQTMEKP